MLTADDIWARGRHKALFGRTSFTVERGEVILIQADSQIERTSLSLGLTGRLKLSGGTLSWDHRSPVSLRHLRSISDIIDSPEVTAPEVHMRVHDYVSEMLSYSLPFFGRPRASHWLEQNDLGELDRLWTEQLTGEQNIRLMSALAAHTRSDLLVFDTPSRHLDHTRMWLPYLQELAENEDDPRAVIAVVPHISESWDGKTAVVGDAHEDLEENPQDAPESIRLTVAREETDSSLDDLLGDHHHHDDDHSDPNDRETLESEDPGEKVQTIRSPQEDSAANASEVSEPFPEDHEEQLEELSNPKNPAEKEQ